MWYFKMGCGVGGSTEHLEPCLDPLLVISDFFKINFFKKIVQEYHQSGPDHPGCNVGPDMGQNCLQR